MAVHFLLSHHPTVVSSFFFFLIEHFQINSKIADGTEISLLPPASTHAQSPLSSSFPPKWYIHYS